jgi:hypothetical protein
VRSPVSPLPAVDGCRPTVVGSGSPRAEARGQATTTLGVFVSPETRSAQNEAVFREINERIEAGHWPDDLDEGVAFRCECGEFACNLLVEVTLDAYERVRADARHFLVSPGHELPAIEVVVERHAGYLVVEKEGLAGEIAEETDPRG